jgi:hypothetical protein
MLQAIQHRESRLRHTALAALRSFAEKGKLARIVLSRAMHMQLAKAWAAWAETVQVSCFDIHSA